MLAKIFPSYPLYNPTIPKWFTLQSTWVYMAAFLLCILLFGYPMNLHLAVIAILSILAFFVGGMSLMRSWSKLSTITFVRNIFWLGLVVRLAWMLYAYFVFNPAYYETSYGEAADVEWYMPFGKDIADWVRNAFPCSFSELMDKNGAVLDDTGYPLWLAIIYLIIGNNNDTLVPMLIKCIVSAQCVVFIYRIAQRHFGEYVARVTAIFVMLNPNLIYWNGTMFKEPEMVFLSCWFVDMMDSALRSNMKLTVKVLMPAMLVGMSLFLFRSALGLIAFAAMFGHIVFSSQRIISLGKKILAGILVAFVLLVGMGDSIRSQTRHVVDTIQSNQQQTNMEWRTEREGGNTFAKYATATVFAPLIFTIPFPTFNQALEGQILQPLLSGGSFIKNIISFFVVLVMFSLLFSGEWRKHVFIIAYLCGYLAALVFSNFAQSGRFHLPAIPLLMLFGAYGLFLVQQNMKWRKWWPMVLVAEVAICLFWNWFKLKGRGMI